MLLLVARARCPSETRCWSTRLAPPRNNQPSTINWACDFELGATLARLRGPIAQLGERVMACRRPPVRARLGPLESRLSGGFRSRSPSPRAAARPPRRSPAAPRTAACGRSSTPQSRGSRRRATARARRLRTERGARTVPRCRPFRPSARVRPTPPSIAPDTRRGTSISIVSATAGFITAMRRFYACLRSKRGTSAWRGGRASSARNSSRCTRSVSSRTGLVAPRRRAGAPRPASVEERHDEPAERHRHLGQRREAVDGRVVGGLAQPELDAGDSTRASAPLAGPAARRKSRSGLP